MQYLTMSLDGKILFVLFVKTKMIKLDSKCKLNSFHVLLPKIVLKMKLMRKKNNLVKVNLLKLTLIKN